ncbi:claudin domain-containing protein 1-like [Uloborus diversus]|uniref:claudin domain-containing protein 1-like n=1 Tax=Uloborus diversus TaxID=327109 RepID=UPI002409579C|nr:claudin domain-containing protein 1-like [Uloborus diversus]
MACSAVSLSVATVCAVVAITCTAIAFGTDNWYEVRVNPDGNERLSSLQEFESDLRYYSRDEGIFRICFPDKRPKGVRTYMSPVQTQCLNIDYYINDNGISDTFTDQRWMRLHMARSVVALFIVSFLFSTLSAFPGLVGCWRRSHSNIIATGLLQLLAGLVVASAIALWHAIPHYEYEKLNFPEMSFSRWPEVLQIYSRSYYGWSYVLAWLGVALTLSSSFMFLCGAQCLRKEKQKEKAHGTAYLVPIYAGPYHCPYSY